SHEGAAARIRPTDMDITRNSRRFWHTICEPILARAVRLSNHPFMIRSLVFLTLALATATAGLRAAAVEVMHVWPGYRDAASFESLGELLGRGETTRGRIVLRSQGDQRDGCYFLVRLRNEHDLSDARVRLEVILPGSDRPQLHEFSA